MTLEHKVKKTEENKLKEEACKLSIKEGSAYSVMDGFGLRYITPYILALGGSTTQVGLLTSVPLLLGSIAELPAIKAIRHHSRKTLVFWGVLIQALLWLAIIGVGALFFIFNIDHSFAPNTLIVLFSILMISGLAMHPVWTSWMRDIVPKNYNNYFGIRNKVLGIVAIISMLIAGTILDFFRPINIYWGFAIIFFIAFIGRAISARYFLKKYEPRLVIKHNHELHFLRFVEKLTESNFGRYALFTSLISLAVAIASPFFAVYMLEDLQLNYLQFTMVSLSSLIIMFLTMPWWGKFADKYGNYTTMRITGFLIPIVPLIWLATPLVNNINPSYVVPYLIIIEAYSGLVWAGYNLSIADFVYDSASPETMAPFMAFTTILSNFGIFIGAVIGGWIASTDIVFLGLPAILVAFLISGILRYIVAFIYLPKIKEIKHVKKFNMSAAKMQFFHLHFNKLARLIR